MELGWFTMDMQEGCLWPVTAVLLTRDDKGDILYFPNHVLTPRGGKVPGVIASPQTNPPTSALRSISVFEATH